MSVIDKIIRSTLLCSRKVFLPDAGTLYIEYKGAKRISDSEIMPPHNLVAFSCERHKDAPSVVDKTAQAGGIEPSQADELYRSWLCEARHKDGSILIQGVGTISPDGKIETESGFYDFLNPDRSAFIKIKKRSGGKAVVIAVCTLAAVTAAAFGVWEYMKVPEPLPAPEPPIVRQTVRPVQQVDTVVPERQPEEPQQPSIMTTDGPVFHIIAGTFSVEANADKYIEQLQKRFSSLQCEKVRLSQSRWMVSIASRKSEQEARKLMSELRYVKTDLWIYESVNRRPAP